MSRRDECVGGGMSVSRRDECVGGGMSRGGSGIKEVVRPTIVAHCGRRCPEALCVRSVLAEGRSADLSARSAEFFFHNHVFLAM